jgi:hypothetical protein
MSLVAIFARVKKLFFRREGNEIRLVDLSEHMRRDLGLDSTGSTRRAHETALPQKEVVIYCHLTRAP